MAAIGRVSPKALAMVPTVALLLCGTAGSWARDQPYEPLSAGPYFSLNLSAVAPFSLHTNSPSLSPAKIRTRPGYLIGLGVGYQHRNSLFVGEVMYGRFDADDIQFGEGAGTLSGYFDLQGVGVDALYNLPTATRLEPYLGAGLGVVRFRANDVTLAGFPPTTGGNTILLQQLMAGVTYAVNSWRLVLGYRLMAMGSQAYETGGVPLHADSFRLHAFQAGAQFAF